MYNRAEMAYIGTMKNNTTYKIQFFHGGEAVWKNAGTNQFATLKEAQNYKAAQVQMCGGMVDFRIEEMVR